MNNDEISINESHRVEFKRELTPDLDLEKEIVAFLNSPEGCVIFVGVDYRTSTTLSDRIASYKNVTQPVVVDVL